jgi:hypothetical protein
MDGRAQPSRSRGAAPRTEAVRRRARTAKIWIGATGTIVFGLTLGLARATYAGHPKHSVEPLSIPQPLYDVVRRNLLQAGVMAPATAPPDATTSSS